MTSLNAAQIAYLDKIEKSAAFMDALDRGFSPERSLQKEQKRLRRTCAQKMTQFVEELEKRETAAQKTLSAVIPDNSLATAAHDYCIVLEKEIQDRRNTRENLSKELASAEKVLLHKNRCKAKESRRLQEVQDALRAQGRRDRVPKDVYRGGEAFCRYISISSNNI